MSPWPRVKRALLRQVYGPRVKVAPHEQLVTLGTDYGGWTFADASDLEGATIVSCGLGEDASFDTEFATRYRARVVIVDPTPRAIAHFEAIQRRMGRASECGYTSSGSQPVEAYDLGAVRPEQLVLVPNAIADRSGPVQFFAPKSEKDVSYSMVNFQNDYSRTTPYIQVDAVTFPELLSRVDVGHVSLVKFDVEGAEIFVIPQMIEAGILPGQVLVEFDELSRPSARARANFNGVHARLLAVGYRPIHFDGRTCVSYARS